ncbi:MAG TPA: hypothetical protein VMG12_42780 [Polyangiaceae bacterium]|nr:hypothetical protein [Polyangiaceae bacterium]
MKGTMASGALLVLAGFGVWSSAALGQDGAAPAAGGALLPPSPCPLEPAEPEAADSTCDERAPPQTDEVPDVASLKTPEAPAFVALGLAPTEIQRPTTPRGVALSLGSALRNASAATAPRNYALEFSPYWLVSRPTLSFDELIAEPERALYRNLSVSFATSVETVDLAQPDGTGAERDIAKVAVGAQTTLWPGSPTRGALACKAYLQGYATSAALAQSALTKAFLDDWDTKHPKPALPSLEPGPSARDFDLTSEAGLAAFQDAIAAWNQRRDQFMAAQPSFAAFAAWKTERDAAVRAFVSDYEQAHPLSDARAEACLSDVNARAGFMASIAGAYTLASPDGDLAHLDDNGSRGGVGWLTLGYVFEDLSVRRDGTPLEGSLLAVLRYSDTDGDVADPTLDLRALDVGVRAALGLRRIGAALEGTLRRQQREPANAASEWDTLYRAALSLDYRLTGGMWLTGTFGKDFGATEDQTPILAKANFQWNFGLERGLQVDDRVIR